MGRKRKDSILCVNPPKLKRGPKKMAPKVQKNKQKAPQVVADGTTPLPPIVKRGRGRPRKVLNPESEQLIVKKQESELLLPLDEIVYFPSDEIVKEEIVESEMILDDNIVGVIEVIDDSCSSDINDDNYIYKSESSEDLAFAENKIELIETIEPTQITVNEPEIQFVDELVEDQIVEIPVEEVIEKKELIEVPVVPEKVTPKIIPLPTSCEKKVTPPTIVTKMEKPAQKKPTKTPVRRRYSCFMPKGSKKQSEVETPAKGNELTKPFNHSFDIAIPKKRQRSASTFRHDVVTKPPVIDSQLAAIPRKIPAMPKLQIQPKVPVDVPKSVTPETTVVENQTNVKPLVQTEEKIKNNDETGKNENSTVVKQKYCIPKKKKNLETTNEEAPINKEKIKKKVSEKAKDSSSTTPNNKKMEKKQNKTKGQLATKSPKKSFLENEQVLDEMPNPVRRSCRIQSISLQKKKSVSGHGVVKKPIIPINPATEVSATDVKPVTVVPSPSPVKIETLMNNTNSAIKVKSRWRLTSEWEMGIISDATVSAALGANAPNAVLPISAANTAPKENQEVSTVVEAPVKEKVLDDIEERLSKFVTILENEYLCERNINRETKKMICDCSTTEQEKAQNVCGEDCINRLLMIECGSRCPIGSRCTNKRFQKNWYAECAVFRTEKKGFGIQATKALPGGEFIMEYVGEVLNGDQFDDRATEYSRDKNKHYYFMALKSDAVIDATLKGNISRFINHSCDPNAETQKWTVNGELRIGFFSKKDIAAGEEITFDYQFQRYGKQAQKCYCESAKCRGWIGEEPNDDSEDELEDEEDEADKIIKNDKKDDLDMPNKSLKVSEILKPNKTQLSKVLKPRNRIDKGVKRCGRPKKTQKLSDDLDLAAEIENLMHSSLKNQTQTLTLCRLMVRAKDITARSLLLNILSNGELSCRRLFLDYHGLRILAGWLTDSVASDTINDVKFRTELIEVFSLLPISNKTILIDTKIFQTVEKFAVNKKTVQEIYSPNDSSNGSTNSSAINSDAIANNTNKKTAKLELDTELLKNLPNIIKQGYVQDLGVDKLKQIINNCDKFKNKEKVKSEKEKYEEVANEEPPKKFDDEKQQIEYNLFRLSNKLLASWVELKEVFRIPKKERIEQMKEHEREADMVYKTMETREPEIKPVLPEKRYAPSDRFRETRKSIEVRDSGNFLGPRNFNFNNNNNNKYAQLDKFTRRHLFEMKVAKELAEKRKQLNWFVHESNCLKFDLNPLLVSPLDVPAMMNPYTEQYYSNDHRLVPQPPIHVMFKNTLPPLPSNIEDYDLPEITLPPFWKYGLSNGKLYYYNVKEKIPQWEPPAKKVEEPIVPKQKLPKPVKKSEPESSTTDTSDTSEDELKKKVARLSRVKRRQRRIYRGKPVRRSWFLKKDDESGNNNHSFDFKSRYLRKKQSKRIGLVQKRIISPRTEEDRLYGQSEMKRYRETKEKIRKHKEEMKLAAHLSIINKYRDNSDAASTSLGSSSSRINDNKLPIVDELDILSMNQTIFPIPTPPRKVTNVYMEWKKVEAKRNLEKRKLQVEAAAAAAAAKASSSKRQKISDSIESNSDTIRKIKDKFVQEIAGVIVTQLGNYMKDSCKMGRITNNEDFKHLAKKLSHFVMMKEAKHLNNNITQLIVTDSVKSKAREFLKKYMAKYGAVYHRGDNESDYQLG